MSDNQKKLEERIQDALGVWPMADADGVVWSIKYDWEEHDDCVKTLRTAFSEDGREVPIDHSPYEQMSKEAWQAHVAMGFARRPGHVAWRNETIIEAAADKGRAA